MRENSYLDYWQEYGMAFEPFGADKAIFLPQAWQANLELLNHLVFYSNVLTAVIGDIDSGKTTLKSQLQEQLGHSQSFDLDVTHEVSPAALLEMIRQRLNLPNYVSAYADEVAQTQELIRQSQLHQQPLVILIDNAQQLSDATLLTISNLITGQGSQAYLHFVLFGEMELGQRIKTYSEFSELKEFIHMVQLGPLTYEETLQYLHHAVDPCGVTVADVFSKVDVRKIYQLSEGYMGRVNEVAKQVLIDNLDQKSVWQYLWEERLGKVMVTLSMLVIVGVVASFVLGRSTETMQARKHEKKPIQLVRHQPRRSMHGPSHSVVGEVVSHPVLHKTLHRHKIPRRHISVPSRREALDAERAIVHRSIRQQQRKLAVIDTVMTLPTLKKIKKPIKRHGNKTGKKPIKIARQQRAYTIQLLGSHNKTKLRKFIKRHHLQAKSKVIPMRRNNKAWYILTYGQYKSRPQAELAMIKLPRSLQQLKPWPRKFPGVKKNDV